MEKRTRKRWLLYGMCSFIFLLLPILSSPDFSSDMHLLSVKGFQRSFISYVLLLIFFYAQMFVFLPKFYFRRKFALFWLFMICCFTICSFVPITLIPRNVIPPVNNIVGSRHHGSFSFFIISQLLFQFLVVGIFSFSLHINAQWKQAERARVDAELAYLKAQINPHFLFNTLNSIYSLAIQKSDATADAVVQLSSMMRYVLTEASKDFVPLQKEIDYISNYIELQKTRLSDNVRFDFEISGRPSGELIAPMLLVPFIENTFKYGVNPDENCEIKIRLLTNEKGLHLHTYNKKVKLRSVHTESNNMGIENVRKRLTTLYPSKHNLHIEEDEHSFTVILSISLQ